MQPFDTPAISYEMFGHSGRTDFNNFFNGFYNFHQKNFLGPHMTLAEKYTLTTKALTQFKSRITAAAKPSKVSDDAKREALLKSFTLATDTFWKYVEAFLMSKNIDLQMYGPNKILLACADTGIVLEDEYLLFVCMIQDRLVEPLGFDQELAAAVAGRAPEYCPVMKAVLERIKAPAD